MRQIWSERAKDSTTGRCDDPAVADTTEIQASSDIRDRAAQPWWEPQPAPVAIDLAKVPLAAQPALVIRAERV